MRNCFEKSGKWRIFYPHKMSEQTPTLLSASNIEINFGRQNILDKASLSIHEGDRIGMVGRNGSGKSTFLKILAGLTPPDAGEIVRSRDLTIGYLSQDFTLDETKTVYQNVEEGARHIFNLIAEYETLPGHSNRADDLEHRIAALDGWNLEYRIKEALSHLNAPDAASMITNLSGGEKRRIAMAKALVARPDLLILDEPTNHLDPEAIEWVIEFLLGFKGAFLVVTHDRYFLDRITTGMVEVSNGKIYSYEGNYTEYLISKAERQSVEERQEQVRQGFLHRELDWVRRGPKARTTKSKSRLDRFFEVAAQGPPPKEMDVDLVIPPPPSIGNRVVDLENVGMELGGRKLFENVNLKFAAGTKVGIAGKNGLGKTTLLKIIIGALKPTEGTVKIGELTRFNYVDQNRVQLDPEKTVYDELGQGSEVVQFGDQKISVRSYLRRFLFTEDRISTQVRHLSGGERSRLLLARILKNGGNFIILDEPTNDLDLASLRVLEEALIGFGGSILVVSHDRYFLDRICNHMIVFEGDGQVSQTPGNYDYYMELRRRKASAEKRESSSSAAATVQSTKSKSSTQPRKLKYKEQMELAGMEATIAEAEQETTRLEELFASPDFYKVHADHPQIQKEIETSKAKVAALYARWEELAAIDGTSKD
ncbi:MAG: transporter [Verrucomicrobiales bacterium]|nr:transporter [Verrucomicrobiales bacterium]